MAKIMAIDYLILGVVALGLGVTGLARGDNKAALFVVIAALVLFMEAPQRGLTPPCRAMSLQGAH
jgi:hypothetical protein